MEMREKVARIIDPVVFKSWQSMIEHCEAVGDGDEDGLRYANATYLKTMEEARTKADAILALLPGDGWEPIETAPKTGISVIVALRDFADGWIVGEAYFNNGDSADPGAQKWWWANQGWSDYYATSIDEGNHPPTHWRPLPAPPALATPGEQGDGEGR